MQGSSEWLALLSGLDVLQTIPGSAFLLIQTAPVLNKDALPCLRTPQFDPV